MRIAIFCHSLRSDWNHGNAHFLRGVATELVQRGHQVRVYEPHTAWSALNLAADHGPDALRAAANVYRAWRPRLYELATLDIDKVLDGVDLVLVHEWNDPEIVHRIGQHRRRNANIRVLFHDTHHRSVTAPQSIDGYDLTHYDGVLAFGEVIRELYSARGWSGRAFTWHEAADVRVFHPIEAEPIGDLVWIGNWGDDERTAELSELLFEPAKALRLRGAIYGVRYPDEGRKAIVEAGLSFRGYLPNFEVPGVFARFAFTVHVPRRPYVAKLKGIPTIRPFEAMACGIPLVCGPWDDVEGLFTPGSDYLVARNGEEMQGHMRALQNDLELRKALATHGRATILKRHTCAHRVSELLRIAEQIGARVDRAVAEGVSHGA